MEIDTPAATGYYLIMTRVYEEIVEFIAGGSTPDDVAEFSPSEQACERVRQLLDAKKSETISTDELAELNHCLELEHLMRLARARAQQHRP